MILCMCLWRTRSPLRCRDVTLSFGEVRKDTSQIANLLRQPRDDISSIIKQIAQRVSRAIHPLTRCRMDSISNLIDLAKVRCVEGAADTLRRGCIELCLPRSRRTPNFTIDVVEEASAPGAATLCGWHGGVGDVDTPFDVSGCSFRDTLARSCSWYWGSGLWGGCSECCREEGSSEDAGESGGEWTHGVDCW